MAAVKTPYRSAQYNPMCNFSLLSSNQTIELQWRSPDHSIEIDTHGMGKEFSIDPTGQMPKIARPDFSNV